MLSFGHTLLYIQSDSLIVISVNVILIGTVQNMNFCDNNFIYPPHPLQRHSHARTKVRPSCSKTHQLYFWVNCNQGIRVVKTTAPGLVSIILSNNLAQMYSTVLLTLTNLHVFTKKQVKTHREINLQPQSMTEYKTYSSKIIKNM